MTQSDTTTRLTQSFNNTSPGAAVMPCCKNVKGEWAEIPKVVIPDPKNNITYLGPGDIYPTYYFDFIPKGVMATIRLRVAGRIKGTLVCKCMDNGQTLSKTQVDEPFTAEFQMPVAHVNLIKNLFGGPVAWALTGAELIMAGKKIYDVYSASPEFVEEVLKQAGPAGKAAVEKIKNSADELCKNMHKCPEQPAPADPGPLIS